MVKPADLAGGGRQLGGFWRGSRQDTHPRWVACSCGAELHHSPSAIDRGGNRQDIQRPQRADLNHHLEGLAKQEIAATRTLASLPHSLRAAGRPRRMSLWSTTSS